MNSYTIVLPSKHKIIKGVSYADYLAAANSEELPRVHASIDGKPSDQFESGRSYVTCSLVATNPNSFNYVYERLTQLYRRRLVKPATLRKTRRLLYLKTLLRYLIAMKAEPLGLPVNSIFAIGDGTALDPRRPLEHFRAHPVESANNGIHAITPTHVVFADGLREEAVTHAQFGGIIHWVRIAQLIDAYIQRENGRPLTWMLHADKLPFDHDGMRMRILGRLLEEALDSRVWLCFTRTDNETDDIPVDVVTDIYVSIFFECKSPEGSRDPELARDFELFLSIGRGFTASLSV